MTVFAANEGDLRNDHPALTVGDFNGDGISDIFFGARFGDGPGDSRQDAGEAYLIFGSENLASQIDIAEGEQDVTIFGARSRDNLGFDTSAADLNGDGIDDLIVSTPLAAAVGGAGSQTGAVYILFGGPDLPPVVDLSMESADVTIGGPASGSFFGDSLATGDVNGDGRPDLIVGATFATAPPAAGLSARSGAVYVFFGRDNWASTTTTAKADVAFFGADNLDELGDFVASGDINGDGIDDIIAAAEAAAGPDNTRPVGAEVHVLFGGRQLQGTFHISNGDQDLWIAGADEGDTLGFALASGDLDGDGIDDLIMGARLAGGPDNSLSSAGEVHVLYGNRNLPDFIDLRDPPGFVATLHGDPSDLLGSALLVRDLSGDGLGELLLGTAFADGPENSRRDSGDLYILDGRQMEGFRSLTSSPLLLTVYGASSGDGYAAALAAGDINGDGKTEIIAAATDADGPQGSGRVGSGRLYVLTADLP